MKPETPPGHIDSFYAATMPPVAVRPPLQGHVQADTCVIGGGLAGLTVARDLAGAGQAVVLLEAQRIAWAASGRNGGFVSPGYAEGIEAIERRVGPDDARALWGLSVAGVEYVRDTIAELDPAGVAPVPGWLKVLRYDDAEGLRRRARIMAEEYDHPRDFWPVERVRETLRTTTYFQGLHDASAFHIHPLNYALALAEDGVRKGAVIHEMSPATRIDRSGGGWVVQTANGSVAARQVVLAVSAYGAGLWRPLERAILPVATYVVASEPMEDRLAEAIRFPGCIGDTRRASDYYRIVGGGRLLWGGRITTRRSEPSHLADSLKRDIRAIYPQLGDFRIEHAWAGLMGYAINKMPIIGRVGDGIWACTGFGGHGLNTTAMGGSLIAAAIANGDDRWRLFSAWGPRWAGGPVGRAATQLVYWKLQVRDRIEERRARRNDRAGA
ncbi:FAD-binding oxidoreductase [Microbaculum marinum]|uniref:FAD-binding oxidoreductase n=1 Tax=Microbaculum marinum TaxID=1764581 RepID=A0AAW9RVU2_9HYPH